jgi:hypothetical protein
LPHSADGCIARMIRNPNGAGLTSDVVLLLWWGVGLLVCHLPRSRGWLLLTQDPIVVIGSPPVAVTVTLIAVLALPRQTPRRG